MRGKRLGDILLELGLIDDYQLRAALGYQSQWGYALGRCLVEMRLTTEETVTKALSLQLGVPYVRLQALDISHDILATVGAKVARQAHAVPLGVVRNSKTGRPTLQVAMSSPNALDAIDALRFASGMDITPILAGDNDIDRAIDRFYDGGWQEHHMSRHNELY